MEKLLIIDSNSLIKKAFYAIPSLCNDEGIQTNAVYGFLEILFNIKEKIEAAEIVAVFGNDSTSNWIPQEITSQAGLLKEILKNLAVNIYENLEVKSRDIIASLAQEKDKEVYIITADKLILQLVSENIKVKYVNKGIYDIKDVDIDSFKDEYKVNPIEYADVKALCGDEELDITGTMAIGEKTAAKLVETYGSVEEIFKSIEKINKENIQKNLIAYKDTIINNKAKLLININNDIISTLNKIEGQKNDEEVGNIFIKLNLKRFLNNISYVGTEETESKAKENIIEVNTIEELEQVLNSKAERAYLYYLAMNPNVYSKISIEKIYLSIDESNYIIDMENLSKVDESKLFAIIKNFMENEDIKKVIHDGKDFITALSKKDIEVKGFDFDTAISSYLIDSARSEYSLDALINDYLGKSTDGKASISLSLLSELYAYLKDRIKNEEMEELYYEVEHPLIFVLSSMESIGFNVNSQMLDELAIKFKEEISKTEKEVYELSEEEFNISSPKQLGKILFEKLDLPVIKKTKTGYSTNAEVLEKLKDKHPIIEKIIYYRQITKLNSTYVEGLKNVIDTDGRIHSSFNQTVTTTGRLSSTEPNLQNIPVKYEMGREIRKVFIPKEENDVLLSCDYSQIELRVLAHMSEDENMIDAFKHHSDIHTKTASEVFKVPIDEVTSLMRSRAKAVNFGIVYGISDFSLSQDLKISKKEAGEYMAVYFDRYPKIKDFLQGAIDEAKENGYVLTILNRRRFIPEIKSSNKIVKALGERLAMNAPIQGSAADIIKLAMVKVFNRLQKEKLKSEIILQVHDELILNVKKDELEKVKNLVVEEMENVFKLSVPLDVDTNIGRTWYEAK